MALSPEAAAIIQRKKLQYCRFADTNQWHLFDAIALPDATFEFFDSSGSIVHAAGVDYSFSSRDDFTAFFSKLFVNLQTIHAVGPAELEQTGPDEVKAIFSFIYQESTKGDTGGTHGAGGGHYHETWKRKGNDWFMQSLRMERIYWKIVSC